MQKQLFLCTYFFLAGGEVYPPQQCGGGTPDRTTKIKAAFASSFFLCTYIFLAGGEVGSRPKVYPPPHNFEEAYEGTIKTYHLIGSGQDARININD